MNPRHCAFSLYSGLFALSERLGGQSLASLAAAVIEGTGLKVGGERVERLRAEPFRKGKETTGKPEGKMATVHREATLVRAAENSSNLPHTVHT